jgi:hypothetical protein
VRLERANKLAQLDMMMVVVVVMMTTTTSG